MFSDDQLHDINLIARFLACDVFAGARPAVGSADLLVLLGNALLPTAWRSFDAVRAGVAPRLLIAGGIGHSTPLLYQALADEPAASGLATAGQAEAPLLAALALRQGVLVPSQIWLESASTNCGENARFARALLQEKGATPSRLLLVQDPLMQRRTLATFLRVWQDRPTVQFASWPTFVPRLERSADGVTIAGAPGALWPLERFMSLLLGEIPRLRDDERGYGPRGRDFIAHVTIPDTVEAAFTRVAASLGGRYGFRLA
ncbi:YdcF family protein [Edwardsiella ictaluri]|uniref:YdcF family protein n=1 Tax=Edwardsiella ictaluri TaxID=67780 RepID=A0ABY8GHP5_EDWIC|nr:YdcF family protein [Edwardsiella ictaluri]WFN96878.1 YdcF family protein [Edwardsiella ictaluri]